MFHIRHVSHVTRYMSQGIIISNLLDLLTCNFVPMQCSPSHQCYMSNVIIHLLCVTFQVSHVTKKNMKIGGAFQWRVCYQQDKTHLVVSNVEIETKDQQECTQCVNIIILKRNQFEDICSQIIKVHQKKEKDQEFQCDKCEYKYSKRDKLRIHRHRNHKQESDIKLKTEEMRPMQVSTYKERVL